MRRATTLFTLLFFYISAISQAQKTEDMLLGHILVKKSKKQTPYASIMVKYSNLRIAIDASEHLK